MTAAEHVVSVDTGGHPTAPDMDIEHGLPNGWGAGAKARVLFWIAVAFSVFQIATAVYAILPSQVLRAVHVGFLVLVSSALIANHRAHSRPALALGWALGVIGFLIGLYHWAFYAELVNRTDELNAIDAPAILSGFSGVDATTVLDFAVGVVNLVVLFVVAWRMMGPALPLICLGFLAYVLWGDRLAAPPRHRGYAVGQVVLNMAYGLEGIYGVPTYVSATYIFLFILFGTFLERAGMIQLFTDVSLGLFGRARGGPAKVAVFASGMMGTISGSGVANVVTVGQFTIPLMIKFGYRRAFAAGVEATASMGGQIMPPVMGAVAFIMAETLGVQYSEIVKAAVIPAMLYFASAFWMVHLEAGKHGLVGMKSSEIPSAWKALVTRWYLVLPLAALVYMLFEGFTPLYAGSMGLALTVALILSASITLGFSSNVVRYIFWFGLALVVAAVSRAGLEIIPIACVVGGLVLI